MTTTSTRISDVIVPSVFTPYWQNRTTELNVLAQAGIIARDPQIDMLAMGAGELHNMPFWGDLTGDSDVGSDDPDVKSAPAKIGTGQDKCRKLFRVKSWSSMDIAGELAGSDPAAVIGNSVAGFWARDTQHILIAILTGVFADNAANDAGDMIINVANDTTAPILASEKISPNVVLLARQTMGDAGKNLVAIAMHSVLYTELCRQNLIVFQPTNAQDIGWGTYLGMTVVVDDGCPAVSGTNKITFTSYLFGPGAIGMGEGSPKVPTEVWRDPASGNGTGEERLYTRRSFILHPRGIKWTEASVAGVSPTNAELSTAGNWDRVYDRKQVRLVAIKTNG